MVQDRSSIPSEQLLAVATHYFPSSPFISMACQKNLVQPLNLQNYHEFEALKYDMFSTCSALGRYMLRTSCILKPRIHGSFKTDRHHRESTFHFYEVKVESRSSRNTGTHLDENLEEVP